MWQPPVLLLRNAYSVPGPIRVSGFATLLFELSGLASQSMGTHLAFSAYSMTLALATHPQVSGWDPDVIAEDHHMFCKCYFASLWDALRRSRVGEDIELTPKVQLFPVYLPAISYLAESKEGWLASCNARFQQARRHSQGVGELGYVILQYVRFMSVAGFAQVPWKTHAGIFSIFMKMHTVHITNTVQAFSLIVATLMLIPHVLQWLYAGGLVAFLGDLAGRGLLGALGEQMSLDLATRALFFAFGPVPPVAILSGATIFMVVLDVLEGRYDALRGTSSQLKTASETTSSTPLTSAPLKNTGNVESTGKRLSWYRRFTLFAGVQYDMTCLAEPTVVIYGLIPEILASWSLMRHGTQFEYIVAAKPV